ncbi:unnamed protein product [Vitrella brassicaformis CCMP3155]|uniref:Uncharacterized protein n=1 Tax=Vitrella brassicaformis (strain CCMP3155) TaxID=1169540 RepID=A0A0G4EXV0_VITBC|nr:unnamed protein product [Vitrella brassicaformis CCMP3155]|eukprot:CEM03230.1 unnamed protein product [Vitrella brassicaformis CCMP3155]
MVLSTKSTEGSNESLVKFFLTPSYQHLVATGRARFLKWSSLVYKPETWLKGRHLPDEIESSLSHIHTSALSDLEQRFSGLPEGLSLTDFVLLLVRQGMCPDDAVERFVAALCDLFDDMTCLRGGRQKEVYWKDVTDFILEAPECSNELYSFIRPKALHLSTVKNEEEEKPHFMRSLRCIDACRHEAPTTHVYLLPSPLPDPIPPSAVQPSSPPLTNAASLITLEQSTAEIIFWTLAGTRLTKVRSLVPSFTQDTITSTKPLPVVGSASKSQSSDEDESADKSKKARLDMLAVLQEGTGEDAEVPSLKVDPLRPDETSTLAVAFDDSMRYIAAVTSNRRLIIWETVRTRMTSVRGTFTEGGQEETREGDDTDLSGNRGGKTTTVLAIVQRQEVFVTQRLCNIWWNAQRQVWIAASTDGKLTIWKLPTRDPRKAALTFKKDAGVFDNKAKKIEMMKAANDAPVEPLRTLTAHTNMVTAYQELGGVHFITGALDRQILYWDSRSWTVETIIWSGGAAVLSLTYVPLFASLVSSGCEKVVRVWHLDDQNFLGSKGECYGHQHQVLSLASAHRVFFSLDAGSVIKAWDAEFCSCVQTFAGAPTVARLLIVAPMQNKIITAGGRLTVFECNADFAKLLKRPDDLAKEDDEGMSKRQQQEDRKDKAEGEGAATPRVQVPKERYNAETAHQEQIREMTQRLRGTSEHVFHNPKTWLTGLLNSRTGMVASMTSLEHRVYNRSRGAARILWTLPNNSINDFVTCVAVDEKHNLIIIGHRRGNLRFCKYRSGFEIARIPARTLLDEDTSPAAPPPSPTQAPAQHSSSIEDSRRRKARESEKKRDQEMKRRRSSIAGQQLPVSVGPSEPTTRAVSRSASVDPAVGFGQQRKPQRSKTSKTPFSLTRLNSNADKTMQLEGDNEADFITAAAKQLEGESSPEPAANKGDADDTAATDARLAATSPAPAAKKKAGTKAVMSGNTAASTPLGNRPNMASSRFVQFPFQRSSQVTRVMTCEEKNVILVATSEGWLHVLEWTEDKPTSACGVMRQQDRPKHHQVKTDKGDILAARAVPSAPAVPAAAPAAEAEEKPVSRRVSISPHPPTFLTEAATHQVGKGSDHGSNSSDSSSEDQHRDKEGHNEEDEDEQDQGPSDEDEAEEDERAARVGYRLGCDRSFAHPTGAAFTCLAFSLTRDCMAAGDSDGSVLLYSMARWRLCGTLLQRTAELQHVGFSGRDIVYAIDVQGTFTFWQTSINQQDKLESYTVLLTAGGLMNPFYNSSPPLKDAPREETIECTAYLSFSKATFLALPSVACEHRIHTCGGGDSKRRESMSTSSSPDSPFLTHLASSPLLTRSPKKRDKDTTPVTAPQVPKISVHDDLSVEQDDLLSMGHLVRARRRQPGGERGASGMGSSLIPGVSKKKDDARFLFVHLWGKHRHEATTFSVQPSGRTSILSPIKTPGRGRRDSSRRGSTVASPILPTARDRRPSIGFGLTPSPPKAPDTLPVPKPMGSVEASQKSPVPSTVSILKKSEETKGSRMVSLAVLEPPEAIDSSKSLVSGTQDGAQSSLWESFGAIGASAPTVECDMVDSWFNVDVVADDMLYVGDRYGYIHVIDIAESIEHARQQKNAREARRKRRALNAGANASSSPLGSPTNRSPSNRGSSRMPSFIPQGSRQGGASRKQSSVGGVRKKTVSVVVQKKPKIQRAATQVLMKMETSEVLEALADEPEDPHHETRGTVHLLLSFKAHSSPVVSISETKGPPGFISADENQELKHWSASGALWASWSLRVGGPDRPFPAVWPPPAVLKAQLTFAAKASALCAEYGLVDTSAKHTAIFKRAVGRLVTLRRAVHGLATEVVERARPFLESVDEAKVEQKTPVIKRPASTKAKKDKKRSAMMNRPSAFALHNPTHKQRLSASVQPQSSTASRPSRISALGASSRRRSSQVTMRQQSTGSLASPMNDRSSNASSSGSARGLIHKSTSRNLALSGGNTGSFKSRGTARNELTVQTTGLTGGKVGRSRTPSCASGASSVNMRTSPSPAYDEHPDTYLQEYMGGRLSISSTVSPEPTANKPRSLLPEVTNDDMTSLVRMNAFSRGLKTPMAAKDLPQRLQVAQTPLPRMSMRGNMLVSPSHQQALLHSKSSPSLHQQAERMTARLVNVARERFNVDVRMY